VTRSIFDNLGGCGDKKINHCRRELLPKKLLTKELIKTRAGWDEVDGRNSLRVKGGEIKLQTTRFNEGGKPSVLTKRSKKGASYGYNLAEKVVFIWQ